MQPSNIDAMLHSRIRDLAKRAPAKSLHDLQVRQRDDLAVLKRGLGLFPELPRTPLQPHQIGIAQRDGYSIGRWTFESRPGVVVPVIHFAPSEPSSAVVVLAHDPSAHQSREPWRQAFGVSFALTGFHVLLVPPPGRFPENQAAERAEMGEPNDPFLAMGSSFLGVYGWDLARIPDLVEGQLAIESAKIGIVGEGLAGMAAAVAFAIEPRFSSAGLCFSADSWEDLDPAAEPWMSLPGSGRNGDFADLLALRSPAPICLIGSNPNGDVFPQSLLKTADKLRQVAQIHDALSSVRSAAIYGPPDLNRRTREVLLAFFGTHLLGWPNAPHQPEKRPITDGKFNSFPAWTDDPTHSDLSFAQAAKSSATFQSMVARMLDEAFPQPLDASGRLVGWGRYGKVDIPEVEDEIVILEQADAGFPHAIVLQPKGIDPTAWMHLGLSLSEIYAQIIHLSVPGAPDGFESVATGTDALSSAISTVKSLITRQEAKPAPRRIRAVGELASLTAFFLHALRPDTVVDCSHHWNSWREVMDSGRIELVVPEARWIKLEGVN